MKNPINMATSATLTLATILAANPAAAQTTSTQSNTAATAPASEGEIIVTAQKRSEGISRVPLSIQAFDGSSLTKAGVTDTSALTAVVPGLTFARSGLGAPIYTLRGIGFNTQNLSATSPVGVYANEIAWAYPYMSSGPTFDAERVEVLKGPQGTLYGRNTTGGLINYISARPTREWKGSLSASYGSYDSYGIDGFVSGPLSDTVGVRLAFKTENADKGWQRSVTRDARLGKKSRQAFRLSIDWTPSDALTSEFTVNYWRDRSDTQAPQAIRLRPDQAAFLPPSAASSILQNPSATQADWDPADDKPPFKVRSHFVGISERLELKVSDLTKIVSLTGYNYIKRDDMNDADGTALEFAAYNSIGSINSFSQELRLQGESPDGKFNYILGGYYSNDNIVDSEVGYIDDATIINTLRFVSAQIPQSTYSPAEIAGGFRNFYDRSDQRSTTKSLFANGEYAFTSSLKLNAGLRYTSDRLRANSCTYDYQGNNVPIFNLAVNALTGSSAILQRDKCLTYTADFSKHRDIISDELKADNLSYRVSLSYQASQDTMLFGSVARGYKSGAYPVLPANVDVQFEPADQERVDAFELGVKSRAFDRALQFNLVGFYYKYNNKQTFGFTPDPVFITLNRILNIPKSRVYGVEADANWRLNDFNFHVSGTWLKSEIQGYQGFDDFGQAQNFDGKSFTFTPELQLSAAVDYKRDLTADLGMDINVNGTYQSKSFGDIQNTSPYELTNYALANASVGLYTTDGRWRVSAFVRNIGNKYYWNYTGYVRDTITRMAGMPRTFGLSVTRNFN